MSRIHMHPLERTFEELRRCISRVEIYQETNLVPDDERETVEEILKDMRNAYTKIPEKYKVSRYDKKKV